MKSVVCVQPGELEMVDRPMPEVEPGHSLVRVEQVGVCGTDLHIFAGKHPFTEYPRVMGHEFSAEIVRSDTFPVRTKVIINPYISCGHCRPCRRNKPNCCANISVLGVHSDGALQEFISVRDSAIIPYEGLTAEEAACVEFLAIGMHAVNRVEIAPGDRILVAGAGPIGIATALFAQIRGAEITMLDRNEDRLTNVAKRFSLERVVVADGAVRARLAEQTNGEFFDCAFDATGNVHSIHASFTYVGHGGTLCLVSVVKDDLAFPDPFFHAREMKIVGSRNSTNADFKQVVAHIRKGDIDVRKFLTHSIAMVDLPHLFRSLPDEQDHLIKAMISVSVPALA